MLRGHRGWWGLSQPLSLMPGSWGCLGGTQGARHTRVLARNQVWGALLHPICLWLQEVLVLLCLGFVCFRGQSFQGKIVCTEGEVSEKKQQCVSVINPVPFPFVCLARSFPEGPVTETYLQVPQHCCDTPKLRKTGGWQQGFTAELFLNSYHGHSFAGKGLFRRNGKKTHSSSLRKREV